MGPRTKPTAPAEPLDPVAVASVAAQDDEPITPEEEAAIAEADRELAQDQVLANAEVRRSLGLAPRR